MTNNKTLSRNKMYEVALQSLTSFLICENTDYSFNILEELENLLNLPKSSIPSFIKELLYFSLKHKEEAITYISKYLNSWKFNRLNYCIQADLIISYAYFFYIKDSIKNVVIDVGVDLAKKYGDKDDYKFVNAILDKCLIK